MRTLVALLAALALAIGGCGAERPVASHASAGPIEASQPAGGSPAAGESSPATASPAPTEVPGPPRAQLIGATGPDGAPAAGALGTFSWDGLTSDAPWLVPSAGGAAAAGSPLGVAFEPAGDPVSWTAAWAPVTDGEAGTPVASDGGAGAVGILVPPGAGPWSLQVVATFGDGHNGAWYWRVEVEP